MAGISNTVMMRTSYNIMYRRPTANASESYYVYFHRELAESRPCSYTGVGTLKSSRWILWPLPIIILVYFLLLRAETAIQVSGIICCIARGESTVIFDFPANSINIPVVFNIRYTDHVYIGYNY